MTQVQAPWTVWSNGSVAEVQVAGEVGNARGVAGRSLSAENEAEKGVLCSAKDPPTHTQLEPF